MCHLDVYASILAWTGAPQPPADPARLGVPLRTGAPPERLRLVERLPLFRDDVTEIEEMARALGSPVERRWTWGRSRLFEGPCDLEVVDGPVERRLTCGGARVRDAGLQRRLEDELRELRARWPPAVDPPPRTEPDDLLRRLRALGYFR